MSHFKLQIIKILIKPCQCNHHQIMLMQFLVNRHDHPYNYRHLSKLHEFFSYCKFRVLVAKLNNKDALVGP